MGNNMACATVAEVEEKYADLELYMRDYIDSLVYNAKMKVIIFHYLRWHGILFNGENPYRGFPSYNHWRFNNRHQVTPFSFSS